MSDLIAIGYPDEGTAAQALEEAQRLAADLLIEPDALAAIRRDADGKFHTTTTQHAVGVGATWGMFWGFLFGLLFFVPVLGLAVGAGLGAIMGKITKSGSSKEFQEQVREQLQPGTSCLFMIVRKSRPTRRSRRSASSAELSSRPRSARRPRRSCRRSSTAKRPPRRVQTSLIVEGLATAGPSRFRSIVS